jgi:hypothetical protein
VTALSDILKIEQTYKFSSDFLTVESRILAWRLDHTSWVAHWFLLSFICFPSFSFIRKLRRFKLIHCVS